MNRLLRIIVPLLTTGVFGAGNVARAEAARTSPADQQIPADLAALLAAVQPVWTTSTSIHIGAGYKDNLLLSRTDPASSGFTRLGVEGLLWHIPRGKIDYFGFLNGEYTRYFRRTTDPLGRSVDHEAQAFGGVEWRFRQSGWLTITLDGQGYYLDQIFDVSDPSVARSIEALKVKGLKAGPTVRWSMVKWLWLEGSLMLDRQRFDDGLNDSRVRDAVVRMGWKPSDRIEFSLAGMEHRRAFDRRPRVAPGRDLAGLLLVHEREAEARGDVTWGAARHWTTHTRVGTRHYLDNAVGYLNFHERLAAQEIEWSAGAWMVHLEGEVQRKQYEAQFAGEGSSPAPVVKNDLTWLARLERKLSAHWTIYAEFNTDRSRSNDEIASYRMKEGLLGARWSWEK